MSVGIAKQPMDDAPHCGDQCGYWRCGKKTILCVVDGLGHGAHAEKAAQAAIDHVASQLTRPLPEIFAGCDAALRHTRGAAMGLAVVDPVGKTVTYAGIGNTRALVVREPSRKLFEKETAQFVSDYGIVGGGYKKLNPETLPLGPGDLLILLTDGLTESVKMAGYDEALRCDVKRLAEAILQDWCRGADDAAVLVFRNEVTR